MSYKIENLKSNTQYEFRIQYKSSMNGGERSDWSPTFQVQTTAEPMTGETVFKAIAIPGKDQLEKLLKTLYVFKLSIVYFEFCLSYHRGPDHFLMEQPDKNGNLPLMHACGKLDIG